MTELRSKVTNEGGRWPEALSVLIFVGDYFCILAVIANAPSKTYTQTHTHTHPHTEQHAVNHTHYRGRVSKGNHSTTQQYRPAQGY